MERVERVLVFLPVLLISVVLHEVAHGWVARTQGDDTAERAGRLTLNPIPHVDLLGSIIVPTLLVLAPGGLLFGWAKPVPVDPRKFRDYRRGDILVSLAGVTANLLLVAAFVPVAAVGVWLGRSSPGLGAADIVVQAATLGIFLNLILATFNLVPIPPLDGSHLVAHLLPAGVRQQYRQFGRYGLAILLIVVFLVPGAIDVLLWPAYALTDAVFGFVEWLV
jgi:Zn-dependent protease